MCDEATASATTGCDRRVGVPAQSRTLRHVNVGGGHATLDATNVASDDRLGSGGAARHSPMA